MKKESHELANTIQNEVIVCLKVYLCFEFFTDLIRVDISLRRKDIFEVDNRTCYITPFVIKVEYPLQTKA